MAGTRSIRARVRDILDEVCLLEEIARETDEIRFVKDVRLRHTAERAVEIISEASRHVPSDFKTRTSSIPWSTIASVGNVLRHEYYRVEPKILWDILTKRLAPLRQALEQLDRELAQGDFPNESKP